MKRFHVLRSALMALAVVAAVPAAGPHAAAPLPVRVDPFALYGGEILFDVARNGENIGFHRTSFKQAGEVLHVNSRFQVRIDILFINAFRFLYESDAAWVEGRLNALQVNVDDDGTKFNLLARQNGTGMRVDSSGGDFHLEGGIFPTNHWNAGVVHQSRVLNTLTGKVNQVRIEAVGRESVMTESGAVSATHYRISGDLDTEVWYDDAGRWVKLRFLGRDGTPIVYQCRRCQGGPAVERKP